MNRIEHKGKEIEMKLMKNLLMLACAFASVATTSAMAADATTLR